MTERVRRPRFNLPGEYKIMAMRGGKNDRFWLRQMTIACYEHTKKRSENLRKINRDTSTED